MATSVPFESAFEGNFNGVQSPPVSLVANLYPTENDLDLEQEDFQMPGSAYLVGRPPRANPGI